MVNILKFSFLLYGPKFVQISTYFQFVIDLNVHAQYFTDKILAAFVR